MPKKKKTHGGKRKGAGRPKVDALVKCTSVSVYSDTMELIEECLAMEKALDERKKAIKPTAKLERPTKRTVVHEAIRRHHMALQRKLNQ